MLCGCSTECLLETSESQYLTHHQDLSKREFAFFLPLVVLTLVMGIYPDIFLGPIHVSANNLLEHVRINL